MDNTKGLILVSAISGVGAREFLQEIAKNIPTLDIAVSALDDQILNDLSAADWYQAHKDFTFHQIQDKWSDSFNTVIAQTQYLLLNVHLIHYNEDLQIYFPVYDHSALAAVSGVVRGVIAICDDVYEVLTENRWKGQWNYIRDPAKQDQIAERYVDSIGTVLMWRRLETIVAMTLAKSLRVPFYLIAVRHDPTYVARLVRALLAGTKVPSTFYLSHNITAIRNTTDWDTHAMNINAVADQFNRLEDVLLFEPTTMDELILGSDGKVTKRWPRDYKGRPFAYTSELKQCLAGVGIDDENLILSGLKRLMHEIDRDVTWRDLLLVYQSVGFLMWRPFWRGNVSGGAMRELEVFSSGANALRPAVLVHQRGDISAWANRLLSKEFGESLREGMTFEHASNIVERSVEKGGFDEIAFENAVTPVLSSGTGARRVLSPGGAGGNFDEKLTQLAEKAKKIFTGRNELKIISKLRRQGSLHQFTEENLDSDNVVRSVVAQKISAAIQGR